MNAVFVTQIREKVESLEELIVIISSKRQRDVLKTINRLRKSIADLRSQLHSKRQVLKALMKDKKHIKSATQVYLRSLFDQITQMLIALDMANETTTNANNTYLARLSVELSEASHELSEVFMVDSIFSRKRIVPDPVWLF